MRESSITAEQAQNSLPDKLLELLKAGKEGLTTADAEKRLIQYGPNALIEKKKSAILKFLSYFWGPIPWMIEVAAILSTIGQRWDDFAIIMLMLVFNALIGFWEEHKAENALDALKKGLALKARVLRDGKWDVIDASKLVPGDIIRIRLGDIVPADVKFLEGEYASIDQSALTGESLPVAKAVGDVGYSGSVVKKGEMIALVTNTGSNTFFGRTAKLVEEAGGTSHFQKAVMNIGNFLIFIALALSALLIAVELHRGSPPLELVQFVLILVIASIPVAMPAVLSVTMALGALALSKKQAIVSKLQAIEELAGVDILCSDKTGTLTKNQLTLDRPILFEAQDEQSCILAAALASKEEDSDPIDLAVIGGLSDHQILSQYKQTKFIPFDPVNKRTESIVEDSRGKTVGYTKGAPQVIMDLCHLSRDARSRAEKAVDELAMKGYRTLGIASQTDGTWKFLGILPLFDPPRDDSKQTIEEAQKYGLSVKMVTGDNTAIAKEISSKLGLGTRIRKAGEFFSDSDDVKHLNPQLAKEIEKADGFAEVYPEHKYGIVRALQERGHMVMMTGDGVNDAPALKQADTGIAVSGATDAARAAAALILTAPGLSVIVDAIKEARRIFERMVSYTIYRIAMTFDIMFFVVLTMLIFPTVNGVPYQPLTPIMIILLALLDDIPIMTIAYDHTHITKEPIRWKMGRILSISTVFGITAVIQTFGLFIACMAWMRTPEWQNWLPLNVEHLQTIIFLQLVAGGHLMLFLTRARDSFFKPPYPSWQLFSAVVGTQIFAALICAYGWFVPSIDWIVIGLVWLYNIAWMFIQDIVKLVAYSLIENKAGHYRRFLNTMNRSLKQYGDIND
ncbi:MAG: plasma-membrane proton-efflux P-type ATPase [Chlamydiales bacterium]|nr:plasma-membrane proton-efflux P-type ATPase [Chlamydiales bacterium]